MYITFTRSGSSTMGAERSTGETNYLDHCRLVDWHGSEVCPLEVISCDECRRK